MTTGREPDRVPAAEQLAALARIHELLDGQGLEYWLFGGWAVDFASYSPAAALEWRGYMTVRAISILQRNHSS